METASTSLLCHLSVLSREKSAKNAHVMSYPFALTPWRQPPYLCSVIGRFSPVKKSAKKMCMSYPFGRTPWRRPPPLCVAWRSGSLDCWSRWRESSILELHPIDNNTKLRQGTRKHRKLVFFCFAVTTRSENR
jgi:hypothetical protein